MALLSIEKLVKRFRDLRPFRFATPLLYVATQKRVLGRAKNAYLVSRRESASHLDRHQRHGRFHRDYN
jgi:hypothetical protein